MRSVAEANGIMAVARAARRLVSVGAAVDGISTVCIDSPLKQEGRNCELSRFVQRVRGPARKKARHSERLRGSLFARQTRFLRAACMVGVIITPHA